MENYFTKLNAIDVSEHTEKKAGLTYLSWAWAWGEVKKLYPSTIYTIYENANGLFYHTDGKTAWVKTGVTIDGIEHIEYLPVMDNRNKSIPLEAITSFDVNKAIQRSLTKAVARHGLGLYIYAGEDLPESADKPEVKIADIKVKDENEPIRMTTRDKIALELQNMDKVRLGKFNAWLFKETSKIHIEELTEKQGQYVYQKIIETTEAKQPEAVAPNKFPSVPKP